MDGATCIEQVRDWLLEHSVAQSLVEQLLQSEAEVRFDVIRERSVANPTFSMILLNVLVPDEVKVIINTQMKLLLGIKCSHFNPNNVK